MCTVFGKKAGLIHTLGSEEFRCVQSTVFIPTVNEAVWYVEENS